MAWSRWSCKWKLVVHTPDGHTKENTQRLLISTDTTPHKTPSIFGSPSLFTTNRHHSTCTSQGSMYRIHFSNLWRLHISSHLINESTHNWKYHVNSTINLSFQLPTIATVQEKPIQLWWYIAVRKVYSNSWQWRILSHLHEYWKHVG